MDAKSAQPVAAVGDVLAGKFRVERVLGEGGMGVVFEATHLLLDERVALKFLRPQVLLQPDIVARFAQEARAAAKLKSEHVARVLDVGEERSMPYIVMEYLEGKTLEGILTERGPLPVHEAVELLIQAAEGISEAHARGIIHRDLKPANLFVAQRSDGWPTLKILDFGISKAVLAGPDAPQAGPKTMSILGSPYYMSPEQLRSTRDVDRRTDIWALGAVLFELLTGRTAFTATEFVPLVNEILEKPHTPLRELRPDAPADLEAVVDRALAKDVAQRFQSAGELALALLPFTTSKRTRVIAAHAVTVTRSSGIDPTLPLPSAIPPGSSSGSFGVSIPSAPSLPSLDGAPRRRVAPSDPMLGDTTPAVVPHAITQKSEATSSSSQVARNAHTSYAIAAVTGVLLLGAGIYAATRGRAQAVAPSASPTALGSTTVSPPQTAAGSAAQMGGLALPPPQPQAEGAPAPAQPPQAGVLSVAATADAPAPSNSAAPAASDKAPISRGSPAPGAPAAKRPPPSAAPRASATGLEIRIER